MAEIMSKNVSVGQCTIYSLQTKNAQGYDIVLLHGAKFQAATWEELTTLERFLGTSLTSRTCGDLKKLRGKLGG